MYNTSKFSYIVVQDGIYVTCPGLRSLLNCNKTSCSGERNNFDFGAAIKIWVDVQLKDCLKNAAIDLNQVRDPWQTFF